MYCDSERGHREGNGEPEVSHVLERGCLGCLEEQHLGLLDYTAEMQASACWETDVISHSGYVTSCFWCETMLEFVYAQSLHLCLTLWDPMDCSPPGFSVHGILQARILEWVAMPSSRGSSWSRHQTWVSYVPVLQEDSLPLVPHGKPHACTYFHINF